MYPCGIPMAPLDMGLVNAETNNRGALWPAAVSAAQRSALVEDGEPSTPTTIGGLTFIGFASSRLRLVHPTLLARSSW